MNGQRIKRPHTKNSGLGGAVLRRIDDDIKATVKKIIQGNEKRKRRMLNGNASAFDRMAYSVIDEALNNSCHNIESEAAREQMQKQIYKSVVHCTPYESIYDVMCGRRQFYDYRNEFITAVAEGLGMLPGSRTKRNTGCSSTTGT